MRRVLECTLAAVLGVVGLGACDEQRATAADCRAIFDRMVVLELSEMGFRDPALEGRRKLELAGRFRDDLDACVGRRLPAGAMDCIATAASAEDVSHGCLH